MANSAKRGPGRPKSKSKKIHLVGCVDPKIATAVEKISIRERRPKSAIVATAIEEWLKRR